MPSPQETEPPRENIALFLDVDGTLIELAPSPELVEVSPDLPAILAGVSVRLGGALALLTGRSLLELDRLTFPIQLPASGLHGGEFRSNGCSLDPPPLHPRLLAGARAIAAGFPGSFVEDKGATLAVHFRATPDAAPALRAALAALLTAFDAPASDQALASASALELAPLELVQGDHVFEIKPTLFDKGVALRRFMAIEPFAGRQPVFIADHPIDHAAFEAAAGLGGVGFAVGQPIPGTAGYFTGPAAVRDWLRGLAA